MDVSIITTYRCNSKCSTCLVWQHPTRIKDEIDLSVFEKIPFGIDNLNLTGGEPTLRKDLNEIVDILYPKAKKLEISSNGLLPGRLESIIKKYPDIKVRFSLEGNESTNNLIRGETDGFKTKVEGLRRLKELGGCDLGFAVTIQDDNVADLPFLYRLSRDMGIELATSALHNGFQFHKADNFPYNRANVARQIEPLIVDMLKTNTIKNWFRAYLNMGLMEKVLGHPRLIPCTAGSDFMFVDPWADVYVCNVRPDLGVGNLIEQTWDEIYNGEPAILARQKVAACTQNCWMVGSARTAMRNPKYTFLPKFRPFFWVIINKIRVTLGLPIPFNHYVNFKEAPKKDSGLQRIYYLNTEKPFQNFHDEPNDHYVNLGNLYNH